MEVLVKLIDTRCEVLDKGDHKTRLTAAINAVKDHQQSYLDSTLSSARNPTQDNIARQQEDLRVLLTAVQEIASIIQLPPPKVRCVLSIRQDHDVIALHPLESPISSHECCAVQVLPRPRARHQRVARCPPRRRIGRLCCRRCGRRPSHRR